MRTIILIVVLLLVTMGLFAVRASGGGTTRVDVILDCISPGNPCVDYTTRDNTGAPGFGHINVSQNGRGDIRFLVQLRGAEPNTTYFINYVCVPSHEEWLRVYFGTPGLIAGLGQMVTDADGNATSGARWIEEGALPFTCPSVEANGHVDIASATATYTTTYGAIPNFTS